MEIKMCKNCKGACPCWCEKHDYINIWDFVYNAMKRTKGK